MIRSNICQYTIIHIKTPHNNFIHTITYKYRPIQSQINFSIWSVLVCIVFVVYKPIHANTYQIHANTYQSWIQTGTKPVGLAGMDWQVFCMYLVCIWYVLVCICSYLHVLPQANPSGFVPICIQDWLVLACIWHVFACIGLYTTNLIQTHTNHYKYLGSIQRNTGVILRQYIVNGLVCIYQ